MVIRTKKAPPVTTIPHPNEDPRVVAEYGPLARLWERRDALRQQIAEAEKIAAAEERRGPNEDELLARAEGGAVSPAAQDVHRLQEDLRDVERAIGIRQRRHDAILEVVRRDLGAQWARANLHPRLAEFAAWLERAQPMIADLRDTIRAGEAAGLSFQQPASAFLDSLRLVPPAETEGTVTRATAFVNDLADRVQVSDLPEINPTKRPAQVA